MVERREICGWARTLSSGFIYRGWTRRSVLLRSLARDGHCLQDDVYGGRAACEQVVRRRLGLRTSLTFRGSGASVGS